MAYSSFLGSRVEVHYRASDLQLTAVGELVSDSRKALVLEERFQQNGRDKVMRVVIPYEFIIRVMKVDKTASPRPRPFLSLK